MSPYAKTFVTLRGELLTFRPRSDDGWGIGTLDVGAGRAPANDNALDNIVDFTGKVMGAKPGAAVELVGEWSEHPRFGRQFKVRTCVTETPMTDKGVIAWLASSLPGIGDARAQAMIDHFGGAAALWKVIEHSPALLAQLDGITPERAAAIARAYAEHRGTRDNQIALRGWGLTDNQIQRCLEEWHTLDAVVQRIRDNPYQLARCVNGFGFKRADEVAKLAGVLHDAPERIEAGLVHVLDLATVDGHCWLWGGALQKLAAEVLEVTPDVIGRNIRKASAHGLVVRRSKRIYSATLEAVERKCSHGVSQLLART